MAEITLAKTAGFCFGVKRAVDKAFELARSGVDAVTLGPIIHNPQVVERLAKMGVPPVDSPDQAAPGQTVLIRSHGVPKKVYNLLKNNPVVDCTCPFVAKIHRIVEEESAAGRAILVAGDPGHPEVQGIMGFSSSPVYTFRTEQELQNILNVLHENGGKPISVVAQTTFHEILWRKFQQFIENHYTNAKIFDTICSATTMRQKEAVELAQQSDYMVVVGGKSSSNTLKLHNRIGVTAGASTPADIIKEVQTTMTEILENHDEELNFAELLEQSLNEKLYTGKRVKGIVTNVAPNELHVDVGAKQAGIVPASEISDEAVNLMEMFHKDDEIDLIVLKVNDQEGIVTLSKKRCDAEAGYDAIREAYENGTVLEGTVTEVVKGGILVTTNGIKVFIPASMTSDRKVEDLNTLLKKDVRFKVIEINDRRRRAVGSIRAVLADEKKAKQEEFWANVEIGKVYHGEVKSLTSYGAFVDLGGVDGMIHITELSWTRIKSPEEVVKVGDMVEVYIKDIDTEKKKISLGYKKAEDNPWEIFKRDYQIGDVAEVKIVSITSFGAFAQIIPGVDGLIHISQIANERIAKVSDKLAVGDVVKAKIIDIDFDKKKVSLSIREVLDEEPAEEAAEEEAPDYAADLEGVDGVTVE